MEEKETIKRSKGQHLKKNEVKTEILRYILDNDSPVLEPDIREHLKKTFGTNDSKTMKAHFQDLLKLNCVRKITNSGKENEWRIDSIKQLINIKENFKEIELHSHKRSIEIVVNKFTGEIEFPSVGSIVSPDEGTIRAYLRLSPTFYYMCMFTDLEIFYYRSSQLNLFSNDILDHATSKGMRDTDVLYDFLYKELPYLAFKQCVYMDILTGKESDISDYAKVYVSLKELGNMVWDPIELDKIAELHGVKPSDIIHDNYLKYSREADDCIKNFKIK